MVCTSETVANRSRKFVISRVLATIAGSARGECTAPVRMTRECVYRSLLLPLSLSPAVLAVLSVSVSVCA